MDQDEVTKCDIMKVYIEEILDDMGGITYKEMPTTGEEEHYISVERDDRRSGEYGAGSFAPQLGILIGEKVAIRSEVWEMNSRNVASLMHHNVVATFDMNNPNFEEFEPILKQAIMIHLVATSSLPPWMR